MQCFRNGLNFIGLLMSCVVYPLFAFKMWISAFIFLDLVAKKAKPSPLNGHLKVSRSRNKIVEPKILPKNERTNLFFYPDNSEILNT